MRVGQVDLIRRPRTRGRRRRRLAARLLAGRPGLGLARRQLGLMLGLLAREALFGARLDRRPRRRQLEQPLVAPRQLIGDRHPVGDVGLVRRLGFGHELAHLGLQLRLDLARMLVGQRAVPAGIGMDLGAIEPDRATVPSFSMPISRASSSTCTNRPSISLRKRRRNVAMVSWSGCSFAATKRNAIES